MGRTSRPKDTDPFGDEVVWAWARTTAPQRAMAYEDWTQGQATYHIKVATLLHLVPDALLLACALEHEHPSVCLPNGRPRVNHFGKLAKMLIKPKDKGKECHQNINSMEDVQNAWHL